MSYEGRWQWGRPVPARGGSSGSATNVASSPLIDLLDRKPPLPSHTHLYPRLLHSSPIPGNRATALTRASSFKWLGSAGGGGFHRSNSLDPTPDVIWDSCVWPCGWLNSVFLLRAVNLVFFVVLQVVVALGSVLFHIAGLVSATLVQDVPYTGCLDRSPSPVRAEQLHLESGIHVAGSKTLSFCMRQGFRLCCWLLLIAKPAQSRGLVHA